MKKYEDFEGMAVFLFTRGNSRFEHGSVIVHNIFAYVALSLSAPQVRMIQERCWFSQIFHIGLRFCFFPANFMASTYTDKNNPFSRCTKRHSQFGSFSQPCFNRIFSNCLSHNSPQEERLGLPHWTMILAICVVVDESICLDIPILDFSTFL